MCQITINSVQTKGYINKRYMYLPHLLPHLAANLLVSTELLLLEESFWRLHNATDYNTMRQITIKRYFPASVAIENLLVSAELLLLEESFWRLYHKL